MNDIFISFSSEDLEIAKQICQFFEQKRLKCWISCRIQDLHSGEGYIQRIREEICSSKNFLLLLSKSSIMSGQVLQEIAVANDRQKYGLRIFPVIIDDDLSREDIDKFAGYVHSGKQSSYWNKIADREDLLNQIFQGVYKVTSKEKYKIKCNIPESGEIIGREEELEWFTDKLKNKQNLKICLLGLGGIGKTALLQALCQREDVHSNYHTIVYLSVEECILRTISNDAILSFTEDVLSDKRRKLSSYEYALYKLSILENSVDQRTLVIVDNIIECANDPLFDRICALNCSLILATRTDNVKLSGFLKIVLQEIKSQNLCHRLFESYYGNGLREEEYPYLNQILYDVNYHTLTIVLLAKQMKYFGRLPHDYQNERQLRIERSNHLAQIMADGLNDTDISDMYTQLLRLLDVNELLNEEKKIMKTMCVLPSSGIYRYLYISLLGDNFVPAIEKLEQIGWIQNSNDHSLVMLHPLVRDIVMSQIAIQVEDPDIGKFVSNFTTLISDSWNTDYESNLKYKELAISIYYQFPNPIAARYKDYLRLSKLLWILDCMDLGLEIQEKVKQLFVDKEGKSLSLAEEAETYLQIGFTYHGKGEYEHAAKELEKAVHLYGNRYATALSHLAQAYVMEGKKEFYEIEPLYIESLNIREKFWPGTISEAASCHLYAKFLSVYDKKLDLAMKLEKRAHQIFKKLQPDGVNVSSTSYILGWLYVQTAEDEEDILFGIKLLEDAKRIRIEHRGNPLHSWMEDIYLKLALSYKKIEDYEKQKEYLELLLQVRQNKYKDTPSQKELIETYELLQEVYNQIGDLEQEKSCKKYLRYYS